MKARITCREPLHRQSTSELTVRTARNLVIQAISARRSALKSKNTNLKLFFPWFHKKLSHNECKTLIKLASKEFPWKSDEEKKRMIRQMHYAKNALNRLP